MKSLIQFLPESNSLFCSEDSKYICVTVSISNFIFCVLALLYQTTKSSEISDDLISPISRNSTRLLHFVGIIVLVRWYVNCNHAVLLSTSNLAFLSMNADGFWNTNKLFGTWYMESWLQRYLVAGFCLITKQDI